MSTRDVECIKECVEALARRSRYGFSGEKPLAVWAMVQATKQYGPMGSGLNLLSDRRGETKQHFLYLAGRYGRIKDARASWSVIIGLHGELQRVLESDSAANAAFRGLDEVDVAALEDWFCDHAPLSCDGAASKYKSATPSTRCNPTTQPNSATARQWTIKSDDRQVEAWADFRLPFEPKGELLAYRTALRNAIGQLKDRPPRFVTAEYVSPELPGNCDVENVLFYNVGASVFDSLAVDGLAFRYRSDQAPPDPSGVARPHYVRYHMPESCNFIDDLNEGTPVATIDNVPISTLNSSTRPYELWKDIQARLDEIALTNQADLVGQDFAITVMIRWPASKHLGVANVIKPLFDAVVSAFHSCQTVDRRVVQLVTRQIGVDAATTVRWLTRHGPAIVSTKCPVELYRGGVRWHPDDSCLHLGSVRVDRRAAVEKPSLHITLHGLV